MDWWNLEAEHTAWEWAAQIAMYRVSPFGERRADWRMAWNTARIVAAQATGKISDEDFNELIQTLSSYLICEEDSEEVVDKEALKRVKENSDGGAG